MLHHGRQTLSIELPGVGAQAALPVGSLEVKLELLPQPAAESTMTEAEVMLALKKEREKQVDCERRFFACSGWPSNRGKPLSFSNHERWIAKGGRVNRTIAHGCVLGSRAGRRSRMVGPVFGLQPCTRHAPSEALCALGAGNAGLSQA